MSNNKQSNPATSSFYSHPLMGVGLRNLFRLFRLYGWPERGHRGKAIMFFLSALARLKFKLIDLMIVAMKRDRIEPIEAPVFILGHWRSGTTHLYNVMSKSGRFHYISPFATALPGSFLSITKLFRPLLVKSLPKGRYIDGVPVEPESPQEDEIALSNVTANSFFHALYFPKDFYENFNRGLFFDGASAEEVTEWGEKLKAFYLKLSIEGRGKRLLIKNPVYTARVEEILKIYPDAKFIHIYRNPYKVFFSMRNFYQKLLAEFPLQDYELDNLDDHILSIYTRMMANLEHDTAKIPKGHFIELKYEDIQKNPLKELGNIYKALNLGPFAEDKPPVEAYLDSVKGYKKNVYDFAEADLARLDIHLRKYIQKGGYKRP